MPNPTELAVRQKSRLLDIAFDDGSSFSIPFELMRVYSPSAEVTGHGPGQEVLQLGKREVGVTGVEPVGNYAIKPIFDDGHASGIYTWSYLYKLGSEQDALWKDYLARLEGRLRRRQRPRASRRAGAQQWRRLRQRQLRLLEISLRARRVGTPCPRATCFTRVNSRADSLRGVAIFLKVRETL